MAKTKYKATLPCGQVVTRSSERAYTHYWAVLKDGVFAYGGFSGSAALAASAAATNVNTATGRTDYETYAVRKKPAGKYGRLAGPGWRKWAAEVVANHGGQEAYLAEVQANEQTIRGITIPVEIVN